jgi:hypothetical protein
MAQIALNKPSGGQLLIQPEDGTSTETVTIPSVGVGKVLNVETITYNVSDTETTSSSLVALASHSYTPVATNSIIHVTYHACLRGYNNVGHDARIRYRLDINGVAGNEESDMGIYDYGGSGTWNKLFYTICGTHANTTGNAVPIQLYGCTAGAIQIVLNASWGGNPTASYITIMEVAA